MFLTDIMGRVFRGTEGRGAPVRRMGQAKPRCGSVTGPVTQGSSAPAGTTLR